MGDNPSTVREGVIAGHDRLQAQVGRELVCNQLGGKETGDADDLPTRDTKEKGDGVKNISEDQLERKLVNREALSDPGEQTVDGSDEGQDGQKVGEDKARNNETEDSALGKSMKGVGWGIRTAFTPIDDYTATGDGLLSLGIAHFRNGNRCGDAHNRGSDQVLGGNAETDVGEQD